MIMKQDKWIEEFKNKLFPIDIQEVDINIANNLKYEHLPTSIFKYRDFYKSENDKILSLENLENGTIWLANPNTFNDPYDSSYSIDNDLLNAHVIEKDFDELFAPYKNNYSQKEELRIRKSINPSLEMIKIRIEKAFGRESDELLKLETAIKVVDSQLLTTLQNQNKASHKDRLKVCSFSKKNDSLLMWAHYSNNHTGFCVEYDIKTLGKENELLKNLYPIIYSNDIYDITKHIINSSKNDLFLLASVLHKSIDWEYEKEWRLVFQNRAENIYKMPKPKAIYLGSKISKENKVKISKIAESKGIPIIQMVLNHSKFELNYYTPEN